MNLIPICITTHLYSLDETNTTADMQNDDYVSLMYSDLLRGVGSVLREIGIQSEFSAKAYPCDLSQSIHEIVTSADFKLQFEITVQISNEIADLLESDPYRDKVMQSDKDVTWFPAWVQINNLKIKSARFDSNAVALLVLEDLLNIVISNSSSEDVVVDNVAVSFDPDNFDKDSEYVTKLDVNGCPA